MLATEAAAWQGRHQAGFARRFEGRDDSGGTMNNRREVTALVGAGNVSLQFAQEHSDRVAVLDRVVSTARIGIRVLGLASMTALTVMFFRPELTDQVKVMSPFWTLGANLSG